MYPYEHLEQITKIALSQVFPNEPFEEMPYGRVSLFVRLINAALMADGLRDQRTKIQTLEVVMQHIANNGMGEIDAATQQQLVDGMKAELTVGLQNYTTFLINHIYSSIDGLRQGLIQEIDQIRQQQSGEQPLPETTAPDQAAEPMPNVDEGDYGYHEPEPTVVTEIIPPPPVTLAPQPPGSGLPNGASPLSRPATPPGMAPRGPMPKPSHN